ncbi:hypothetical protein [Alteromonas sp. 009811495]|uniref:hypothetical protein n=1 Tax=Alteromonas sp. 009811495 TaxID=3002962 RepID=UPI00237D6EC5|nr:hypothetical protein [Alteromonas sp. 009811495]WDT87878.1 hypothetical protein OZ660_09135 [Alteromonas sp. 009811495]
MNKYLSGIRSSILTISCVALAISYFTQSSLLFAVECICVVIAVTQLVHMPEELPSGYDNPDGEEIHPKWLILFSLGLALLLFFVGWLIPTLWEYVAFSS